MKQIKTNKKKEIILISRNKTPYLLSKMPRSQKNLNQAA
jgi:hypothetical protein